MASIAEKAQELGHIIGQSQEYQALKRAHESVGDEEALRKKMDQLQQLAQQMDQTQQQGQEPPEDQVKQYESLLSDIQGNAEYQKVVAAQSNFDKLMLKVNQDIMEGIKKGADSRIITLG